MNLGARTCRSGKVLLKMDSLMDALKMPRKEPCTAMPTFRRPTFWPSVGLSDTIPIEAEQQRNATTVGRPPAECAESCQAFRAMHDAMDDLRCNYDALCDQLGRADYDSLRNHGPRQREVVCWHGPSPSPSRTPSRLALPTQEDDVPNPLQPIQPLPLCTATGPGSSIQHSDTASSSILTTDTPGSMPVNTYGVASYPFLTTDAPGDAPVDTPVHSSGGAPGIIILGAAPAPLTMAAFASTPDDVSGGTPVTAPGGMPVPPTLAVFAPGPPSFSFFDA